MKLTFVLIVSLFFTTEKAWTQWDTITSFNQVILDLEVFNGKLFACGNFTENEGDSCMWSASYDGAIVERHLAPIAGGGSRVLGVLDNTLYGIGTMEFPGVIGVAVWNGTTWIDGGSTTTSHATIFIDSNIMYEGDDFGHIRTKTPGNNFQTFYDFAGEGTVHSISKYNGNIILAGNFDTINGIAANNIAQWDGVNWSPLGDGVGKFSFCMKVYNNELYVAGMIDSAGGQPVNGIAKWDGLNWSDVDGGETVTGAFLYSIRDMEVHDDKLIIVGDFSEMGFVQTNDVAMWDGNTWYSLNIDHDDGVIDCIEIYNNQIYIGSFNFVKTHIFRYTGSLKLEENKLGIKVAFYPNPVKDDLNIEIRMAGNNTVSMEIFNLNGKSVFNKTINIQEEKLFSTNLNEFSSGTFIVRFIDRKSGSTLFQEKIIIQ